MKNEMTKIDENNTIAESTKLIREMFDFVTTKRQMDIIYTIISLVQPTDTEFKEYRITYKNLGEIFNPANPTCPVTKESVTKAINSIMNSSFRIQSDNVDTHYHWIEKAKNYKKEQYVTFQIHQEVREFYLQLQKGEFTIYLLKDLLALSTVFQATLFRWLCTNSGFKNDVEIDIEKAKLTFYGKKIQTYKLIEKLDSALKKISAKTSINASYEKVYKGKKIVALRFKVENHYIKEKKERSAAKIKADDERNREVWQRLKDIEQDLINEKEKVKRLEIENEGYKMFLNHMEKFNKK